MKVYIAKHYWKDGEDATWESHKKIDKKLFEYLKSNYHNFVKDRPLIIKEEKKYIYFCYEDTVDVYNRTITNVTFFVSKYEIDKDLSEEKNEKLCKKSFDNLELDLLGKKKIKKVLRIELLCIILALVIVGLIYDRVNSVEHDISSEGSTKLTSNQKQIESKKVLESSEQNITTNKKKISSKSSNENSSKKIESEQALQDSKDLRDGIECTITIINGDEKHVKSRLVQHDRKIQDISVDLNISKAEFLDLAHKKYLKKEKNSYTVEFRRNEGNNNESNTKN